MKQAENGSKLQSSFTVRESFSRLRLEQRTNIIQSLVCYCTPAPRVRQFDLLTVSPPEQWFYAITTIAFSVISSYFIEKRDDTLLFDGKISLPSVFKLVFY